MRDLIPVLVLACLAPLHASVAAVIAICPSSVVFQGITEQHRKNSSWSVGGEELPFAAYVMTEDYQRSRRLTDLYEPSLAVAPTDAEIPIEKIRGPILLVAGKEDALWPSTAMAERLVARARAAGARNIPRVLTLAGAGHHVARIPLRPTGDSVRLGGTAGGIAAAQLKSWREIVRFLETSLGSSHR